LIAQQEPARQGAPYALFAWPHFVPKPVRKYASIVAATAIERLRGNTAGFPGMNQLVGPHVTLGADFGAVCIIRHG